MGRRKKPVKKETDDVLLKETSSFLNSPTMTRHTSVIQKSKKPASIRNLKKDVKAVIEKLICAVEAEVDGERKEESLYDSEERRKGSKRRVSYDISFKAAVLKDLKRARTRPVDVAEKHKIHKSLVTKWQKQEKEIMEAAAKDNKRMLKRRRPKISSKKKRDKA